MKTQHLIAPALALVTSIFWIGSQESTLTVLLDEKRAVLEKLGKVATRSSSDHALLEAESTTQELNLPDGSPDWKTIATLMAEDKPSTFDIDHFKAKLKLRLRYLEMSEEEIIEGLAEIESSDLDQNDIYKIKNSLFHQLIEKNPERALNLTGDVIDGNNDFRWARTKAFSALAKTDPLAAMAWLDRQVSQGHLTSKSLDRGENPRLNFESKLLGQLVVNDPAAARARLASFGEAERQALLSKNPHEWRVDGKVPEAFLALARENLPEEQATIAIAKAWTNYLRVDLGEMTTTLNKPPFFEKERAVLVRTSVSNFTSMTVAKDNYEKAYQWAKTEAPDQAGAAIGNALFDSGDMEQALGDRFKEALQLSEILADPEIAREFARQYASGDPDLRIEDPALAAQLKVLSDSLSQPGE